MPAPAENAAAAEAAFAAALLDPDRAVPPPVAGPGGKAARARYGVYRNNVVAGLATALEDIFPAVRRIVGPEFFAGMARVFVRAHPPRSPLLFEYGGDFPAFVAAFGPARDMPYLADVARIELSWLASHHAADAAPLGPAALASVAPDDLPGLPLRLHPAARIVRSRYAAFSIFTANREERTPEPVRADAPEDTLVARPGLCVRAWRLAPGGAAFCRAAAGGATLASACEAGFGEAAGFDAGATLALLLGAGALAGRAEGRG